MQFVKGGPDVPERLLQAHEEGQVVFFSGAGISYPAGLPTFSGLVNELYAAMGIDPDPVEVSAIKAGQYDTAVGLLEARVLGGRQNVREKLASILEPDLNARNATATHEALLTLAKDQNDGNRTRLITTNFDRLFETVIAKASPRVQRFRAPLLPVPKQRWDGLVYLHGLLTENPSETDLERLIISSGDFGLAYLTEGWAARFVSELLRNYVVCFVGYSINDLVLRYMMDALAADRLLGESPPEMFAFGNYSRGKEEAAKREWRAKNVTPILYREHWRHAYLHRTLWAWSNTYRDGARGKERIVVDSAMANPLASTKQDDFVGRMIWALSDPSGLPAKRFAKLDPVPSLEWLEPLSDESFGHPDLPRFGILSNDAVDEDLSFRFIHRPSPSKLAPWMGLVGAGTNAPQWDDVMWHIAHWLLRYLDDPDLLLWFATRGGRLHDEMARLIEWKLEKIDGLQQEEDQAELDRIRESAPKAIPGLKMRTLWQLLLKRRVGTTTWASGSRLHSWCEQFRRHGLTVAMRLDLREILEPRLELKEPFTWRVKTAEEETGETPPMHKLVDADIVFAAKNVRGFLDNLADDELWIEALPELLDEFTLLLRDALDLMREVELADERSDQSYFLQPSISEHPQNGDNRADWTVLVELVRDSWLATLDRAPESARMAAEAWWCVPYPVFRRLAFFAAAQRNVIPHRQALDWLLSDHCWWLWSAETLRETMRLLASLAERLNQTELHSLEKAILAGPPREMYRDSIEPEEWAQIQDRGIWLRLERLSESGARLGLTGTERLAEVSERFPDWQLTENETEEFSFWVDGFSEGRALVATPREPQELIKWLEANADSDPRQDDDWAQRCREEFDATSAALISLAERDIWPLQPWSQALYAWSREKPVEQSWVKMAPVLSSLPEEYLPALSHALSHWLEKFSKTLSEHETILLTLCDCLFNLNYEKGAEIDDSVGRAINHPVGQATQALLNWLYREPLSDGQGLTDNLKPRFARICEASNYSFRHGRVLLAANVIALFRVDRDWTTQYVLPLFDWERSDTEAGAAWEGFLWSPRLYPPLMEALKSEFLETANHYARLGRHAAQYSSLLTFAAMEAEFPFTRAQLATATRSLSNEGLENAAMTLVRALEGAGEQRSDFWRNRVSPYLRRVWPKTQEIASASIAESFALLCVAANDEFPAALMEVRLWLQQLPHPEFVVRRVYEAKLPGRFPEETLTLLDATIGGAAQWPPQQLGNCLEAIRQSDPAIEQDARFQRLVDYLHIHGKPLD